MRMLNLVLLAIVLLITACKKEKINITCKQPSPLSNISFNKFNGEFLRIDTLWQAGNILHLRINGTCVTETQNIALLYDFSPRMPAQPVYEYNLYLADSVNNSHLIDCRSMRTFEMCFNLNALLPDSGTATFRLYRFYPNDTLAPKTFYVRK